MTLMPSLHPKMDGKFTFKSQEQNIIIIDDENCQNVEELHYQSNSVDRQIRSDQRKSKKKLNQILHVFVMHARSNNQLFSEQFHKQIVRLEYVTQKQYKQIYKKYREKEKSYENWVSFLQDIRKKAIKTIDFMSRTSNPLLKKYGTLKRKVLSQIGKYRRGSQIRYLSLKYKISLTTIYSWVRSSNSE